MRRWSLLLSAWRGLSFAGLSGVVLAAALVLRASSARGAPTATPSEPGASQDVALDHIVAIVGERAIFLSELDAHLTMAGAKPGTSSIDERKRDLALLIDEELIAQAANRAKIWASPEEVAGAIERDAKAKAVAAPPAEVRRRLVEQKLLARLVALHAKAKSKPPANREEAMARERVRLLERQHARVYVENRL